MSDPLAETSANQAPGSAPAPASPKLPEARGAPSPKDVPLPKSPTAAVGPTSLSAPSSPTTLAPPPVSLHKSTTHISQVQPHASFFRIARPNDGTPRRPRPSSLASASSAVQNRLIDAIHLTPLSRQLSTTSDDDSVAARRAPIGGKHSREPLLPLGVPSRDITAAPPKEPSTPTSAGRVRGSIERLFRRASNVDSIPMSPTKASMHKKSPLQAEYPTAAEDGTPSQLLDTQSTGRPSLPRPRPQRTSSVSSQKQQFISHPPPGYTPFVPRINPSTGKPERNYENYPSSNIFFMRGHLLTGGDTLIPFITSLILVLGISGTWFATTCVYWWHSETPAVAAVGAYMCLITVSSMLATALRDPGILPRDLDPDPPYPSTSNSDGTPSQPFPRDLRIGENVVRVKYCATCRTYRPPRSSHCKACDNCIDACDHHCQWVNNCVGRRNYTSFITFLVAASLTLVLALVTAALHLYLLTRRDKTSFLHALGTAPGSAVVFALGVIVIWPLLALMAYHVRLLLLNVTTIEQVRNKVHASLIPGPTPPNPFSLGRWHHNVAYLLCRPAGYTWIDAAGVKMEDRREINPGEYGRDDDDDDVDPPPGRVI